MTWYELWLFLVGRSMESACRRMAAEGPSPALLSEMNRLVLIARVLFLFVIVFMMVTKLGT
jgi:hypothetical protein